MNLEESNEFIKQQNSKKKKKKLILALIVICAVFVVILFLTISFLKMQDANTYKLFINNNKANYSSTLFQTQDDISYVSVKQMARIAGYSYESGEYKKYNEDKNYCYITNDYEIISFGVDNNIVKKYLINSEESDSDEFFNQQPPEQTEEIKFIVKSSNETMQLFELSNDVIKINDEIYVPTEKCEKIFNVNIVVDGKATNIYTISYLYEYGLNYATTCGYQEISAVYENVRAIVDGILIVKDAKGKYGAISMADNSFILGMKYSNILYIQNSEEFFVYTENSVGLIDKTGKKTIIQPTAYDDLSVFDEINKLYLAQKNGVYGILDREGKEVIPVTYDSIGMSTFTEFELSNSETPNILEEKYIVVTENQKYGLYNLKGNRLLKSIYDAFGYIIDTEDKKTDIQNLLIIPKKIGVHGLVFKQSDYYGIYDLDGEEIIIPCSLDKIYLKTESGEDNYYMVLGDDKYNIKEFLEENGITPEDENEEDVIEEEKKDSDDKKKEKDKLSEEKSKKSQNKKDKDEIDKELEEEQEEEFDEDAEDEELNEDNFDIDDDELEDEEDE